VTLVGDAAHPMTPNQGQGACQALEDAVALGKSLNGVSDFSTAFKTYEGLLNEARLQRGHVVAPGHARGSAWKNRLACAIPIGFQA